MWQINSTTLDRHFEGRVEVLIDEAGTSFHVEHLEGGGPAVRPELGLLASKIARVVKEAVAREREDLVAFLTILMTMDGSPPVQRGVMPAYRAFQERYGAESLTRLVDQLTAEAIIRTTMDGGVRLNYTADTDEEEEEWEDVIRECSDSLVAVALPMFVKVFGTLGGTPEGAFIRMVFQRGAVNQDTLAYLRNTVGEQWERIRADLEARGVIAPGYEGETVTHYEVFKPYWELHVAFRDLVCWVYIAQDVREPGFGVLHSDATRRWTSERIDLAVKMHLIEPSNWYKLALLKPTPAGTDLARRTLQERVETSLLEDWGMLGAVSSSMLAYIVQCLSGATSLPAQQPEYTSFICGGEDARCLLAEPEIFGAVHETVRLLADHDLAVSGVYGFVSTRGGEARDARMVVPREVVQRLDLLLRKSAQLPAFDRDHQILHGLFHVFQDGYYAHQLRNTASRFRIPSEIWERELEQLEADSVISLTRYTESHETPVTHHRPDEIRRRYYAPLVAYVMAASTTGRALKGSRRHLQGLVNDHPEYLNCLLLSASQSLRVHAGQHPVWVSPRATDEYREYQDSEFLDRLGLSHLQDRLAEFWPRGGPVWDALARVTGRNGSNGVILVEAKSHSSELKGPGCRAEEPSRVRIEETLQRVQRAMGVSPTADWMGTYYQYTNRLAHLYFLNVVAEVPAWLVFLYFVGDTEQKGPDAVGEWEADLELLRVTVGMPATHLLSERVIHVFVPANGVRHDKQP